MKKFLKMLLLVFFLLIIYIYTLVISNIPNKLVIFEGESINMKTLIGMNIKSKENTIETASTNGNKISEQIGKRTLEVSFLDTVKLKDIDVNVLPRTTIIPVGNIAGVKLYTSGVLVVGMSEIEGNDSKNISHMKTQG